MNFTPNSRDKLIIGRLKPENYRTVFRRMPNGKYWVTRGSTLIGFVWREPGFRWVWNNSKGRTYQTRKAAGEAL
jgi:hypothetical protein